MLLVITEANTQTLGAYLCRNLKNTHDLFMIEYKNKCREMDLYPKIFQQTLQYFFFVSTQGWDHADKIYYLLHVIRASLQILIFFCL